MIKVIIDKHDLSLITDELQSSSLNTTSLDDGSVVLLIDDTSYETLEAILKKITQSRQQYIFDTPLNK